MSSSAELIPNPNEGQFRNAENLLQLGTEAADRALTECRRDLAWLSFEWSLLPDSQAKGIAPTERSILDFIGRITLQRGREKHIIRDPWRSRLANAMGERWDNLKDHFFRLVSKRMIIALERPGDGVELWLLKREFWEGVTPKGGEAGRQAAIRALAELLDDAPSLQLPLRFPPMLVTATTTEVQGSSASSTPKGQGCEPAGTNATTKVQGSASLFPSDLSVVQRGPDGRITEVQGGESNVRTERYDDDVYKRVERALEKLLKPRLRPCPKRVLFLGGRLCDGGNFRTRIWRDRVANDPHRTIRAFLTVAQDQKELRARQPITGGLLNSRWSAEPATPKNGAAAIGKKLLR